ncbi:hypothetical protein [Sulfitobacter sp.]|uniref:hypothetical protein n=1 Tax=Sulfitobacter sp. TaxID=1903071 RepID=UPI003561CC17
MKAVSTVVLGVLLTVCLTLYGSFGMASAGEVFSMEICADGVAKTVLFDADGNPVEPAANCPECLTCCRAIGSLVPVSCPANASFATIEILLEHLSAQQPLTNRRHSFPAPRGPPVVQATMVTQKGLIIADHPEFGQTTNGDGRLLFKDAIA